MSRRVEVVVKVGGSLAKSALAEGAPVEGTPLVDAVCATLGRLASRAGAVVVPGGGPFADAVREADQQLGLDPTTAHRMALLAMDQYGWLLADRIGRWGRARTVPATSAVVAALERGEVPILLPAAWLDAVDPLPHSWDVTGDSIAAWIAGECGAARLVLVKRAPPPGAETGSTGPGSRPGVADLVAAGYLDPYFPEALPPGVAVWLVDASAPGGAAAALEAALAGRAAPGAAEIIR